MVTGAGDIRRATIALLEAEGEQVARDMAGHLGDQLHDVLKRNGMLMRSVAGGVTIGALAAAQVLTTTLAFGRRSMSDDDDAALIEAGAIELFLDALPAATRTQIARQARGRSLFRLALGR